MVIGKIGTQKSIPLFVVVKLLLGKNVGISEMMAAGLVYEKLLNKGKSCFFKFA